MKKYREAIEMWIAWHLPKRIAYWCAIRVGAHATTGKWSNEVVPDVSLMDALNRWDK